MIRVAHALGDAVDTTTEAVVASVAVDHSEAVEEISRDSRGNRAEMAPRLMFPMVVAAAAVAETAAAPQAAKLPSRSRWLWKSNAPSTATPQQNRQLYLDLVILGHEYIFYS